MVLTFPASFSLRVYFRRWPIDLLDNRLSNYILQHAYTKWTITVSLSL